jgi:3-methyladenine DNA glycosylase AlkC
MQKVLLKDQLFNQQKVNKIAKEIKDIYPAFKQKEFESETLEPFGDLELKARISHISDMLQKYLPNDFIKATTILLKALPQELDESKSDGDFGEFIYASYGEFVATFGCNKEHLEFSLDALMQITKRFSAEYAIREFINRFPNETLQLLERSSHSNNYHQRRLVSEGLRPNLPWGKSIGVDHNVSLTYLDNLFYDSTRFVTRSVANHLNDISKTNPSLVIERLKMWRSSNKQNDKEMDYITKHALRTLIKNGDQKALALLGYPEKPNILVSHLRLKSSTIDTSNPLDFCFDIKAKEHTKVIIEYIIHYQSKNNTPRLKVYKLKNRVLKR